MNYKTYTALVIVISFMIMGLLSNRDSTSNIGDGMSANPCQDPLTITVGEIDDRFGITESEVIATIKNVSEKWSEDVGIPVVSYSESGEIELHLRYDVQQQMTDRERQFRNRLQMKEYQIEALETNYLESVENFEEWNDEYQRESERVQEMLNQLNAWIEQVNSEGGFNSEQLEILKERRASVDRLSGRMEQSGVELTERVNDINNELRQMNRMIEEKNMLIQEYNETFSGTRRFTQGSYEQSENGKWINIFQFTNREELELVIAHEIGHALGLEHVENPASVMHHLMGQQPKTELVFTEEDRYALESACDF